ncbi:F-box-like domain superfamily [Arabidopsis suecica]|uniref:F-box-like domain superfamily n=1 Tax=Arabidopsis suecica TaxID=45249 RepID=A0A8T1XY29_ARASU|nr:F-box-like domain superfamily [Arabidopsis suecica]
MAEVSETTRKEMTTKGKSENSKKMKTDTVPIAAMNEDLLHNILLRLPAKSFAFASCVNRSWSSVCNRILSRPKMISAFSRNPDQLRAGEEVLDKVLSEPIRPDFVIANITCGNMEETLTLITERVGSRVPIIVSVVTGILGKEACNDKAGEVKQHSTGDDELFIVPNFAILLTIGYLPGMKVDVIPVIQAKGESESDIGDKFVMDIRNYVSMVSGHAAAPACLILFGEDTHATEPVLHKLDYAMPAETVIVGDQIGEFLHKCGNESRNVQLRKDEIRVLAGLIFARDRHRPAQAERIQFDTAISRGMSSVDLRYKAANVNVSRPRCPSTLLTAKRRGEAEVLDGEQILDDIDNILENHIWENDPYLGVIKRRKYSIGLEEKPKIMSSLVFHQVNGSDDQDLLVDGAGIKTGDQFQVYLPDLKVAEASLNAVTSQLRNLKSKPNKPQIVGGFAFVGNSRGDLFFGRPDADSSPFLENFPELRFGGIFCDNEIGRNLFVEEGEEKKEVSIRRFLHVYSSVYLIVSYTS